MKNERLQRVLSEIPEDVIKKIRNYTDSLDEKVRYIVQKNGRLPGNKSYKGPTWNKVNFEYKEFYDSFEEAKKVADELSKHNPVGFSVHLIESESNEKSE